VKNIVFMITVTVGLISCQSTRELSYYVKNTYTGKYVYPYSMFNSDREGGGVDSWYKYADSIDYIIFKKCANPDAIISKCPELTAIASREETFLTSKDIKKMRHPKIRYVEGALDTFKAAEFIKAFPNCEIMQINCSQADSITSELFNSDSLKAITVISQNSPVFNFEKLENKPHIKRELIRFTMNNLDTSALKTLDRELAFELIIIDSYARNRKHIYPFLDFLVSGNIENRIHMRFPNLRLNKKPKFVQSIISRYNSNIVLFKYNYRSYFYEYHFTLSKHKL